MHFEMSKAQADRIISALSVQSETATGREKTLNDALIKLLKEQVKEDAPYARTMTVDEYNSELRKHGGEYYINPTSRLQKGDFDFYGPDKSGRSDFIGKFHHGISVKDLLEVRNRIRWAYEAGHKDGLKTFATSLREMIGAAMDPDNSINE